MILPAQAVVSKKKIGGKIAVHKEPLQGILAFSIEYDAGKAWRGWHIGRTWEQSGKFFGSLRRPGSTSLKRIINSHEYGAMIKYGAS